jgi:hypothetical protein
MYCARFAEHLGTDMNDKLEGKIVFFSPAKEFRCSGPGQVRLAGPCHIASSPFRPSNCGSLAMLAAMRRASSRVS